MRSIQRIFFTACVLAAGTTFAGIPVAQAAPKKVEKKCDEHGKACKSGDECKPENCKAKGK